MRHSRRDSRLDFLVFDIHVRQHVYPSNAVGQWESNRDSYIETTCELAFRNQNWSNFAKHETCIHYSAQIWRSSPHCSPSNSAITRCSVKSDDRQMISDRETDYKYRKISSAALLSRYGGCNRSLPCADKLLPELLSLEDNSARVGLPLNLGFISLRTTLHSLHLPDDNEARRRGYDSRR